METKTYSQGENPTGTVGYIIGVLMNLLQTNIYFKIVRKSKVPLGSTLLDLGCGGGAFIHKMVKNNCVKKACGIDHSDKMIGLSTGKNKRFINEGLVDIRQASVAHLPFNDTIFDTATALETIQFWPVLETSIREVGRVLKKNGHFIIINRFPEENRKWYSKMQLKNTSEYEHMLTQCGFTVNKIDKTQKRGWIIIFSEKK
jgi:ubiquinone/menaquinone biosynthesis C-methylase UbiE